MIYLGFKSKQSQLNYNLSIESIAICVSYYMDISIQIDFFKNTDEFEKNIDNIVDNITMFDCQILISNKVIFINILGNEIKVYSILGVNKSTEPCQYLVLSHEYSNDDSIVSFLKSGMLNIF